MEALIEIHRITVNAQIIQEAHIEEFVELLEDGVALPPVTVRRTSGGEYRLVDGRHRLEARRRLGQQWIRARVTL